MRPSLTALLLLSAALLLGQPAAANDSMAALDTGGLVLERSAEVEMAREHLRVSPAQIAVDYVFRNRTDRDITARVAFPMPDVTGSMDFMVAVPREDANLLGFSVTQDGKPLQPQLEARAFAGKEEITAALTEHKVPLQPFGEATEKALAAVPDAVAADWEQRGIIGIDEYDAGQGWQRDRVPLWRLASAWHWQTIFPAGRQVAVAHRYTPSLGGSAGITFMDPDGKPYPEGMADYRKRYCMDDAFIAAVGKRLAEGKRQWAEQWISYVLGTGGNWAGGRIGDFTLEVDKGSPDALVSVCADGVEKTGETTFRVHKTDFAPPPRLDVLIIRPLD